MEHTNMTKIVVWKPHSKLVKSETKIFRNKKNVGSSFRNLFANALINTSSLLKPGVCGEINHSNCIMMVNIKGDSPEDLMSKFLNKVLKWTYVHQTIFCYLNVKEVTNRNLVAQVFGVWYDVLDERIKAVRTYGFTSYRNTNGLWQSSIDLEFEMD